MTAGGQLGDLYSIVDTEGRRLVDDIRANPKIVSLEYQGQQARSCVCKCVCVCV